MAGMCISEKLARNSDHLFAFRDPAGPRLSRAYSVDNKDKAAITEGDLKKVIPDANKRHAPAGVIAAGRKKRNLGAQNHPSPV